MAPILSLIPSKIDSIQEDCMGHPAKFDFESFFPKVEDEDMEQLRNFLEKLQVDLQKQPRPKRKRLSKKPRARKKRQKTVDYRIQDLPFHF
jgi:hypothetical protein